MSNPVRPQILIAWLVLIASMFCLGTYLMAQFVLEAKIESNLRHLERIDQSATEDGRTAADQNALEQVDRSRQTPVVVGIYIDRISQLSFRDATWTADFYIWFRWDDADIDPGDSFQVVDGRILSKQLESSFAEDGHFYALYRVLATKTKFFSVSRFPRDDHLLTLRIEDSENRVDTMIYVPDEDESAISSRVAIPGYHISDSRVIEKPHSYKTRRGDTRLPEEFRATYSQLVFGIMVVHPGWSLYFKMFLGTFSSVAIAMLSFFVHPSMQGPRFSVGIGAFFAAVASTYVVSQQLPQSGAIGLTDFVTGTSLVTIFLILVTTAISISVQQNEGQDRVSQRFDIAAFFLFLFGYVGLNTVISVLASN